MTTFSFTRFGKTMTVDLVQADLPEASNQYLWTYGAKQSLSDSFAGAKTEAEFEAALLARVDKIKAGTMGVRMAQASRDPFETLCLKIAAEKVDEMAKAKKVKLSKENRAKLVVDYRARQAEWIEAEATRRQSVEAPLVDDDMFAGLEAEAA